MGIRLLFKSLCSSILAKRGLRITRYPIVKFLRQRNIETVLDVGANTGQFAQEIRNLGYRGNIHSFEPLPNEYAELCKKSASDTTWKTYPFALGSTNCTSEINISANSPSSSFLPLSKDLDTGMLNLATIATVNVEIKRLDDVFQSLCQNEDDRAVYLKIDTQGFERQVIDGASEALKRVSMVQMELALVPNYEGESLVEDMIRLMRAQNFVPWWVLDGYRNNHTLQLYQVDVFFANNSSRF